MLKQGREVPTNFLWLDSQAQVSRLVERSGFESIIVKFKVLWRYLRVSSERSFQYFVNPFVIFRVTLK